MHKLFLQIGALFLGAILFAGCASQNCCIFAPKQNAFRKLPANCDPKMIGEKISTNFLARKIYMIDGKIVYPEVCAAFGALRFADAAGDKSFGAKIV